MICEIEIPNTPGAGSRRAAGTGERKMNKSKPSPVQADLQSACFFSLAPVQADLQSACFFAPLVQADLQSACFII